MSSGKGENLRVPPILTRGGPFNTNNTSPGNDDVSENLEVSEELTKQSTMILQLSKLSVVSRPNINGLIDVLPRRAPRARYGTPV